MATVPLMLAELFEHSSRSQLNAVEKFVCRTPADNSILLAYLLSLGIPNVTDLKVPNWSVCLGDISLARLAGVLLQIFFIPDLVTAFFFHRGVNPLGTLREIEICRAIDIQNPLFICAANNIAKCTLELVSQCDISRVYELCPNLRKLSLDRRSRLDRWIRLPIPATWIDPARSAPLAIALNSAQLALRVYTYIEFSGMEFLPHFITGLEMIDCRECNMQLYAVLSLLHLNDLRLRNWYHLTVTDFEHHVDMRQLRKLALSNTSAATNQLLRLLIDHQIRLAHLDLSVTSSTEYNVVSTEGLFCYLMWDSNTCLKVLIVDGHPVEDGIFHAEWSCIRQLKRLSFLDTRVTVAGVHRLAALRKNHNAIVPALDIHLTAELQDLAGVYQTDPQMVVHNFGLQE
jgi:hypothetical protein